MAIDEKQNYHEAFHLFKQDSRMLQKKLKNPLTFSKQALFFQKNTWQKNIDLCKCVFNLIALVQLIFLLTEFDVCIQNAFFLSFFGGKVVEIAGRELRREGEKNVDSENFSLHTHKTQPRLSSKKQRVAFLFCPES